MAENVYVCQFKVELLGIEPAIWRRIQVPETASLWDLHVAIQDAMGWQGYHLHVFSFLGTRDKVGIPLDEETGSFRILPGWKRRVDKYLSHQAPLGLYEYDLGDSWFHEIRFEGESRRAKRGVYPRCLAGARRCPPEDCGGPSGYVEFLKAISNPKHPEHDFLLQWAGGAFDPEEFSPRRVRFSDPEERWRQAFES